MPIDPKKRAKVSQDAIRLFGGRIGSDTSHILEMVFFLLDNIDITSEPPSGSYRIFNLWRTPEGNIGCEFESIPEP